MSTLGTYDYVIAGGGSAGCVLAARLSEDPKIKVLLVEAGGKGKSLFVRMPAGNGFLFGNPKYDWRLESVPQRGLNGRQIYYPRGRGLGGTSLLNGLVYMRGNAADYDRWHRSGLPGWSYAEVLPYFRRAEGAGHRTGCPFHGSEGPLLTSRSGNYDRINEIFVEACRQAGAAWNADFNGARQLGVSRVDTTISRGQRQSTAVAYLSRPRENLTVLTDTLVLAVEMAGRRAVGLKLSTGGARAEREVILSLGAFASPQLLMLSGLGPADHLKEMGIGVRADLPGVGSRLFDHPNMPLQFALADKRMSLARFQRLDRAAGLGLRYLLTGTGPGAAPFWSTVLFHSFQDSDLPDLEVYFTPMVVREEAAGSGWSIQNVLNLGRSVIARGKMAAPGIQIDINILRPKSSGSVRLASADPSAAPVIDPAYLQDPADLEDLIAGLRHMREVARQPAFEKVITSEISPGGAVMSDADLEEAVRNLVTTGHHPVATCPMGAENDSHAVLDAELKVRSVENLRVVDASAFPDQISGNTNAPVIMMAEKASDMILGRPALAPGDPRGLILTPGSPASGESVH